MTLWHDSQSEGFRTPPGALACGEEVVLRLAAGGEGAASVRLWWAGQSSVRPMEKNAEGLFEARVKAPDAPGLLWYYFFVEADGKTFYGNAPDCLGGGGAAWEHEPPSFQITVYDPGLSRPDGCANR